MELGDSEQPIILISLTLNDAEIGDVFDHLVVPELLTKWWPTLASVEPGEGGGFQFDWPDQGFVLKGSYLAFDRPNRLCYTWNWDHEPTPDQPLIVSVHLVQSNEQVQINISHGPFAETEQGREDLANVREGWSFFLPRLQAALTNNKG